MKIRKSQEQITLQASDEQRNLNSIERTSPSGAVTRIKGQVTVDFASCGAAAVTIQTVALPGAKLGDVVLMSPPAAGLSVAVACCTGYVSAADVVKMPVVNPTAGALDPASATFEYTLFRQAPLSA
jgi:hypothetical protein